MSKDSSTAEAPTLTAMKAAFQSLHEILSSLPDEASRQRLLHFSAANSALPLNEFLDKFEDEEAGRAEAAERENARRAKVLTEAGEIFGVGPGDVVARLSGVEARGEAGKV